MERAGAVGIGSSAASVIIGMEKHEASRRLISAYFPTMPRLEIPPRAA
jgi:hypothetical protein